MRQMTPAQELAEEALKARRRELALALRACRPHERLWLRKLPEHRYEPYGTANALGMSNKTVMNMLKRPRVKRAMEVFLQDALDEIGISHTSLIADLVEIKNRCMQAEPVLDKKGVPTGEYVFDAAGATTAIKLLMDLMKLAPAKRIELTTRDGKDLPAPVFHISFEDGGPGDYGIEVSGDPTPGSDALN